ncbi:hypothetical protein D3870_04060 [Noviherbaspirillum cavernae]|uniref:Uncharacterized protein n=1 Tax=Noviherbaspirillum cavernae TaxID=2320862 RepID=A0A418WYH4_9BURK|nr:M48 family metallopeptidase [Noviherbaspirillum cavernae]RJG05300.1 hypothetical protein D3870_04060 [Noviherbaspirillum cavernae]
MISATYFDGQTTRRHPVTLMMHKGVIAVTGEGIRRSVRLSKLNVSERLEHAPRIMRFPDGGFVEVQHRSLDKLLRKNGYRDPWVVHWQQNWAWSLIALITVLTLLIAGYQWGLPWAADKLAQRLPASLEKSLGDGQWKLIDEGYLRPSRLDAAEQARLRQLFAELARPRGEKTVYRLEFRDSRIGPNAFALPNGIIVMTDQLVTLARNDHAVLAVLAHELGHLQRHHSLRQLLQTAGTAVVVNLLIGDVSSVAAAAPTFLLDQKYSRDFEREADRYAIDMMRENGLPLSPMADLFERMGNALADADEGVEGEDEPLEDAGKKPHRTDFSDYFSSHPSDQERIARLRAADARQ